MHGPAVPETNFMLGRMRVDINQCRVQIEIEDIGRMAAMKQDIAVSLAHSADNHLVANSATIQIKVLQIRLTA